MALLYLGRDGLGSQTVQASPAQIQLLKGEVKLAGDRPHDKLNSLSGLLQRRV
jgi:hypothetical protein